MILSRDRRVSGRPAAPRSDDLDFAMVDFDRLNPAFPVTHGPSSGLLAQQQSWVLYAVAAFFSTGSGRSSPTSGACFCMEDTDRAGGRGPGDWPGQKDTSRTPG